MERKSAAEKIKQSMGQTQSKEGSQQKSKTKKSKSNALAVHQGWEQIVQGLAASSDDRLSTLTNAFVSNRRMQASAFVDLMEAAEDGSLDQQLIMEEYMARRQQSPHDAASESELTLDFDIQIEEKENFMPDEMAEIIDIAVVTAGFYQSPVKQLNSAK